MLRTPVLIIGLALGLLLPIGHAQTPANAVLEWNELAVNTVRTERYGAFPAARLYAMANVAMFDAVNGIDIANRRRGYRSALISPRGAPRFGNPDVAAAAAAHAVLSASAPALSMGFDAQLRARIVRTLRRSSPTRVFFGYLWGRSVGHRVNRARANDGTETPKTIPGGTGPGEFRADFTSAHFGEMRPFGIRDAAPFFSAGPPALGSKAYADALAEVQRLGDARTSSTPRDQIANFWKASGGSARPPGEWIKIAMVVAADQRLTRRSLSNTARLFALLGMAIGDSAIPSAGSKARFLLWRPATAIRNADTDGNSRTVQDPNWAPRTGSIGGSPEHTSGQSTFAGAGSTILAGFYGRDRISFTFEGDNAIAGPRTFRSFSSAAEEAGRARIFAGIHFEFSNQAGQKAGRGIATEILRRRLRPR